MATAFTVDLPRYIADFESFGERHAGEKGPLSIEEARLEAQVMAGFGAAHFMQFRTICEQTTDPEERKVLLDGLAEMVELDVKQLVQLLLYAYS